MQRTPTGSFQFVNVATSKCLTVVDGGVQQLTCNDTATESWVLQPAAAGVFEIVNVADGKRMTSVGTVAGAQLAGVDAMGATAETHIALLEAPVSSTAPVVDTTPAVATALAKAVVYQVYVDIFSSEGDFAGVTAKLSSLRDLGVDVLYLMPVTSHSGPVEGKGFFGPRGSPYAVEDFFAVNPDFGTEDDLTTLLDEAHRLGMKVILDEVLNHTGWTEALLTERTDFYARDANGEVRVGAFWVSAPLADTAQLDYFGPASVELQAFMVGMLSHWLETFPIDGFRFDAASFNMSPVADRSSIPPSLWRAIGTSLRALQPDVILLGEDLDPVLALAPFNVDYGFDFYPALVNAFRNGSGAEDVRAAFVSQQAPRFPAGMLHLNILQSWDEAADHIVFGGFPQARAAAVVNCTLPGVPMLFNGEEAGNESFGGGDGDNTMTTIDWTGAHAAETTAFFRALLALRATHPALQQGELVWLHNDSDGRVVSYVRGTGHDALVVAVNLSATTVTGTLSGVPSDVTWIDVSPAGSPSAQVHIAPPAFALAPYDFAIFAASE